MICPDLAFVFPGQGAQRPHMLDGVRHHAAFRSRYAAVCAAAGCDVRQAMAADRAFVDQNLVSSLVTVLVSSIALDEYQARRGETACAVAGYSVGQWTALYAAGCVEFEAVVGIVAERARLMDRCFVTAPGAMMAVIGVAPDPVRELCAALTREGHAIFVSNENCYGQYSLAGTVPAVELALERVRVLQPRRAVRLPVSGAWHCPLLAAAEEPFAQSLDAVTLRPPAIPVADNSTGEWLPRDMDAAKPLLASHLTRPVLWDASVRRLLAAGCRRIVELGFGDTLTKFGYFIDRTVTHVAFCPGA